MRISDWSSDVCSSDLHDLLLVATLVTRLAQELAVLLLRHALAALLDDGTHVHLASTVRTTRALIEPRQSQGGSLPCAVVLRVRQFDGGRDGGLRDAVGTPESHGRQFSRFDEPIDRKSGG